MIPATKQDGKWVVPFAVPVPPAWTNVTYATDPNADLLVTGTDKKGRPQAIYSKAYQEAQAQAKFARVEKLHREFDKIWAENEAARNNPQTKDAADCLRVIMQTGIRPGSRADTGADKKAYGATTLKGSHVYINEHIVRLTFTGKKGVYNSILIQDEETKRLLIERKNQVGARAVLFGITEKTLLDHAHRLGNGSFTTKDFRTLVGTRTAIEKISTMRRPATPKTYKKAVKAVALEVAAKLGNTPAVALSAYINPKVFAKWQAAIA